MRRRMGHHPRGRGGYVRYSSNLRRLSPGLTHDQFTAVRISPDQSGSVRSLLLTPIFHLTSLRWWKDSQSGLKRELMKVWRLCGTAPRPAGVNLTWRSHRGSSGFWIFWWEKRDFPVLKVTRVIESQPQSLAERQDYILDRPPVSLSLSHTHSYVYLCGDFHRHNKLLSSLLAPPHPLLAPPPTHPLSLTQRLTPILNVFLYFLNNLKQSFCEDQPKCPHC